MSQDQPDKGKETTKNTIPEWLSALGHLALGVAALASAAIAYCKGDDIAQKIDQLSESTAFIKDHKGTLEDLPGALVGLKAILNEINNRMKSETAQTTVQKDLETFTAEDSTETDIASALKSLKEPESETDITAYKPYIPTEKFDELVQNVKKEKDPQAIGILIGDALEIGSPFIKFSIGHNHAGPSAFTKNYWSMADGEISSQRMKEDLKDVFIDDLKSDLKIKQTLDNPNSSVEDITTVLEKFKTPIGITGLRRNRFYIPEEKFKTLIQNIQSEKSPAARYLLIFKSLETGDEKFIP